MTHDDKGHLEVEDRGAVLIVRVDGGPHSLSSWGASRSPFGCCVRVVRRSGSQVPPDPAFAREAGLNPLLRLAIA